MVMPRVVGGLQPNAQQYVFQAAVQHKTSAAHGQAQLTIQTGRVPAPTPNLPAIKLSPASGGVALSTRFTVTAANWTDAALPLSFAFAYVNSKTDSASVCLCCPSV